MIVSSPESPSDPTLDLGNKSSLVSAAEQNMTTAKLTPLQPEAGPSQLWGQFSIPQGNDCALKGRYPNPFVHPATIEVDDMQ